MKAFLMETWDESHLLRITRLLNWMYYIPQSGAPPLLFAEGVYHCSFQYEPPRHCHTDWPFLFLLIALLDRSTRTIPEFVDGIWVGPAINMASDLFTLFMRHQHPAHSISRLPPETDMIRLLSPIQCVVDLHEYLPRDWYVPECLLYPDILRPVFICGFSFFFWVWLCCGSQSEHHFFGDSSARLRYGSGSPMAIYIWLLCADAVVDDVNENEICDFLSLFSICCLVC